MSVSVYADNQSVELSVCSLLVRMEVVKKTKHYNNGELAAATVPVSAGVHCALCAHCQRSK